MLKSRDREFNRVLVKRLGRFIGRNPATLTTEEAREVSKRLMDLLANGSYQGRDVRHQPGFADELRAMIKECRLKTEGVS